MESTDAVREFGLNRIIELTRKWQDLERWEWSYELPKIKSDESRLADEHDHKAEVHLGVYVGEQHAAAKYHHELGRTCKGEAKQHKERATQARQEIDKRRAEIVELENLVRLHSPKLIGLVPFVDHGFLFPPTDLLEYASKMRAIESAAAALLQQPLSPSAMKPSEAKMNGPQKRKLEVNQIACKAILDDQEIPLKQNQAKALVLLIERKGEYLSLADHGLRSRDIDALPPALKELVETQPGAGTRILKDKVEMA